MARETTPDRIAATATATPEAPAAAAAGTRARRATATTPTAPLGATIVEPIVEQVDEGGDIAQDIPRIAGDPVDDRDWLTRQIRHLLGCPLEPRVDPDTRELVHAPFHAPDGEKSRSTRIDITDSREPRHPDRPFPRTYRVLQCNECGARARVRLPRTDDD